MLISIGMFSCLHNQHNNINSAEEPGIKFEINNL